VAPGTPPNRRAIAGGRRHEVSTVCYSHEARRKQTAADAL